MLGGSSLILGSQLTQITRTGWSDYKILVCKEHGFCCANLWRHLLEHHTYSRHAHDVITQHFGSLNTLSLEDAALPTTAVEPFECLRAPRPALRCAGWADQACKSASTSKEKLARHCNERGWRSDVGDREHWFPVTVQSFCPASHSPRWFALKVVGEDDGQERDLRRSHRDRPDGWWKKTGWI
jgi:hypothetical protein